MTWGVPPGDCNKFSMAAFKRMGLRQVKSAYLKNREYTYDGLDSGVNPCGGFEPPGMAAPVAPSEWAHGPAHGGAPHGPGDATGAPGVAALAQAGAAEPVRAIPPATARQGPCTMELLAAGAWRVGQPVAGSLRGRAIAGAFCDAAGQRLQSRGRPANDRVVLG